MKQRVKKLLLKDFLETRELDSCVHHGLEMALENVMDGNVGASALYHLDNLCYDVFQSIPIVTDERTLFRFTKKPVQKPSRKKKLKKTETGRRPPFKFSMIDLKPGDEVVFDSRGWTVKVASDNTIEYKDEEMRMSTFCKKYLPDNKRNKDEAYQGPAFFSYHGKTLADIRDENEMNK